MFPILFLKGFSMEIELETSPLEKGDTLFFVLCDFAFKVNSKKNFISCTAVVGKQILQSQCWLWPHLGNNSFREMDSEKSMQM